MLVDIATPGNHMLCDGASRLTHLDTLCALRLHTGRGADHSEQ